MHKGHDDSTFSGPSSLFVKRYTQVLQTINLKEGLGTLRLTQHLTTRADDSHAPSVALHDPNTETLFKAALSVSTISAPFTRPRCPPPSSRPASLPSWLLSRLHSLLPTIGRRTSCFVRCGPCKAACYPHCKQSKRQLLMARVRRLPLIAAKNISLRAQYAFASKTHKLPRVPRRLSIKVTKEHASPTISYSFAPPRTYYPIRGFYCSAHHTFPRWSLRATALATSP